MRRIEGKWLGMISLPLHSVNKSLGNRWFVFLCSQFIRLAIEKLFTFMEEKHGIHQTVHIFQDMRTEENSFSRFF